MNRDTWGPPRDGWPTFDDEGKRVTEAKQLDRITVTEQSHSQTLDPRTGAMIPTQPRGMGKRRVETVPPGWGACHGRS